LAAFKNLIRWGFLSTDRHIVCFQSGTLDRYVALLAKKDFVEFG